MAVDFHKDVTGADLHISKFNTNAGDPAGSVTAGNIAEPLYDTTNDNVYVSNAATNSGWQLIYSQQIKSYTPSGTTQTLDFDESFNHSIDLDSATGDVTLTLSNPYQGQAYVIKVIQGATARNLVWPGTVKWPGGTAPTISTTNNDEDIITLWWDGTSYYGNFQQVYS